MNSGRGHNLGASTGRPGATAITTGKGYHVIPAKSGRGAKLPVVPGTVPANTGTGTFGRLFGGKTENVSNYNNPPAGTRSAVGNRAGNIGNWLSGQQSRSLDADYQLDGYGNPINPRSQLETVVEAGRGVRKLPAQPGAVNTLPMQNQVGMPVGPSGASNMVQQHPVVSSHGMQNGAGAGQQQYASNKFGIAGTAITALNCMQPGAPNGSAVNVVHNPGDYNKFNTQMDNGYGPPHGNMMDMSGGGNQFQAEVQVMQQPQQQTQHPSVQFAQPEWT